MTARTVWLTCVVLVASATVPRAQTLDFISTATASTTGARGIVSVDLNRDGWLDVATANTGRNTVAILFNRGTAGGFLAPYEIAVSTGPFDIAAGDLDRDGVPDLVVTAPDAQAIDILRMGSDGTLVSRLVLGASESRGAALADVTRDGILDLVFSDYALNVLVVRPGDGAGGFAPAVATVGVSARPQGVVAGDFNHDGRMDVAVASTGSATLDVLYGAGSGGFTRRTVAAGRALNVLTAVDLNADGWVELAAAATSTSVVSVFRGGVAGFALAGTRATGASPRGIASADINQDGRPDLVTGNFAGNSLTVLLGRRDGSVLPDRWGEIASGSGARAVAAGDFDNDGAADLAAGVQSAAQLWLHRNTTPFVTPALSFTRRPTGLFIVPGDYADFNENGVYDAVGNNAVRLDGATTVTLTLPDPRAAIVDVAAPDYDGDGHADVLLAFNVYSEVGLPTSSGLLLYRGNGRGQFSPAAALASYADGVGPFHTGDIDRDGDLDVVASAEGRVRIVEQTASGPVPRSIAVERYDETFQIADVNRDGSLDLMLSHFLSNTVKVYAGDGEGGFGAPTLALPMSAYLFALGDMDHDGRLDVVVDGGSSVFVALATGDGVWSGSVEYPSYVPWDTLSGPTLGDFDSDGHLDVLTWAGTMLTGNGDGTLDPPALFDLFVPNGIAVDWNRDGLLDLVNAAETILNERRASNRVPVANAGSDQTYTYLDQFLQNDGSLYAGLSSDPDMHRLSYEWRDHTGAVIGSSEIALFAPRPPGTYIFTLVARDGRGGEDTDAVQITILPELEIVLHPGSGSSIAGDWRAEDDPTAAAGRRMFFPNAVAGKVEAPLASPGNSVDMSFAADPTQTYKLWVRLKAESNYWGNDSVWVQFSGAVNTSGQPDWRIGTTSGLAVNLEECSGCGVAGWGWEDDGWGAVNRLGTVLRFPDGGVQQVRIQVREDGVSIDQVVLSAVKYRTARPGTAKNDTVILPTTQW